MIRNVLLFGCLMSAGLILTIAEEPQKPQTKSAESVTPAQITRAYAEGDFAGVVKLADQLLGTDPEQAFLYVLRARAKTELGAHAAAASDYGQALKRKPAAELYNLRGEANFRAGDNAAALADFDKAIELAPQLEAGHWQRGICYYYAGDYEKGRKQFEQYQNVDDNDVENVVWRAMCMAKDPKFGWDKAAADLLKVRLDRRVPLMTVHQLFADKATPADVLKAIDDGQPDERELLSRRFYANLYLGLYHDARNEPTKAREHLELAAGKYKLSGYMAEVARVHLERLKKAEPKK